ncbi:MAG: hypothetical protein LBQ69_05065, partial [Treponema sp.]|nr:hypothetical protein [Treponema sp.]
MKKFLFFLLAFALATGFAFAGGAKQDTSAQAQTITVGGSTSVAPLMELFKAEYEAAHSNV